MKTGSLHFIVEFDREEDGRFIAEVRELPGVLAYGPTREAAKLSVEQLVRNVILDRVEHGELSLTPESVASISFSAA
jgi:predicted RNase H-like HicB family nuclease